MQSENKDITVSKQSQKFNLTHEQDISLCLQIVRQTIDLAHKNRMAGYNLYLTIVKNLQKVESFLENYVD